MLSMGLGLLKPIKQIAEVVAALGETKSVFLVFGPTMIFGVLGCWGVFGETIAPIANCCLMFPPTFNVQFFMIFSQRPAGTRTSCWNTFVKK